MDKTIDISIKGLPQGGFILTGAAGMQVKACSTLPEAFDHVRREIEIGFSQSTAIAAAPYQQPPVVAVQQQPPQQPSWAPPPVPQDMTPPPMDMPRVARSSMADETRRQLDSLNGKLSERIGSVQSAHVAMMLLAAGMVMQQWWPFGA